MATTIGFIGGGRMAEALIQGICASGLALPEQIFVVDLDQGRRTFLHDSFGVSVFDQAGPVVDSCDLLVLAVKPQVMAKALGGIKDSVQSRHLLVSIAAGVSLASIETALDGAPCHLVRVMPNTPALVGEGAAAISPGKGADEADVAKVKALFDAVGQTVVLAESYLDAVTGLSGSGPAYVFSFIEGLIDGGVKVGLPRPEAQTLVLQTVLGSAKLAMETKQSPADLKAMVTSPGGTTIAGLHAMARAGFQGILMDAVEAATKRSRELGE
nr:pyrroline-5-carboxylate reductase [Desulfobulbaceae bacterium]